jgi:glucuronoarabinoxylan endo-1,4-beta-xylanase
MKTKGAFLQTCMPCTVAVRRVGLAILAATVLGSQARAQSTINWNDVHQQIDGFGASCAWTAQSLSDSQADMFFSVMNGIGLSLCRNRIAPNGTTLERVTMQKAQARGAKVWSTPWSPPAAFKDSGTVNGGNFVSDNNQAYANQLAAYAASMKNNYGINLYAISIQNEPDYNTTAYESCLWSGQQFHDFIPYLYNALVSNGVSSTRIMLPESANWYFSHADAAMNDVTTSNQVGILAAHAYFSTASPVNSYGKALWETEVSTFETYDGSIDNGIYWAQVIHNYLTVAEVNAWSYWWLISGNADNEGLTDQSGNPAKRMYVLGNFSKFVRPGYNRIGATDDASVFVSAYKDNASGKFAIVAINTDAAAVAETFNLNGFTPTSVTPWITSSSLSLVAQSAIPISSNSFIYTMPARSVVTFVGQFLTPFQAWQMSYFGSTTNVNADANADPDGDGQNNEAEFLSGSNPTNSASALRITAVAKEGNDIRVTWMTGPGKTNAVQCATGDAGGYSNNFVDITMPPHVIIPGSGDPTTNYLDMGGATNAPSRFYRVRLVP